MRMGRTVFIVDDQPEFRLRVRELLDSEGFVVVGEAGDVQSAIAAGLHLHPQVMLVDVRLPDGSGTDIARATRAWASPPVVVLTSTADYSHAVRECGAAGFIPKASLSGARLAAVVESA